MKLFIPDHFETKQKNKHDEQPAVAVHESIHSITEGSEFLDDAIRTKEQPFMYSHTEESIAPGSPKGLW